MEHRFAHPALHLLPNWQAAFPEARRVGEAGGDMPVDALLWVRVLAGATPLSPPGLPAGGRWVALLDEPDDALVLQSLEQGAAGACNTHAAPEVLRQVAQVVTLGGLWVGQSLLQKIVGGTTRILAQRQTDCGQLEKWAEKLSAREAEVARRVADGLSNREIAAQLHITERTVKAHLTAVFDKLGIRDRLQLSLRIRHG